MKSFMKTSLYLVLAVLLIYLLLPNPDFPLPLSDALQSMEPADTETPLRRSYFTNKSREEVMAHYVGQFSKSKYEIPLPTYRLNYPPEEAWVLIRKHTRSTFLEEIVHPFRESLYVNGFKPKEAKDVIFVEGKNFEQKITVKMVNSSTLFRTILYVIVLGFLKIVLGRWKNLALSLMKLLRKI